MGDAFFCITLSVIVIRMWWKHHTIQLPKREKQKPITEAFDFSKLEHIEKVSVEFREEKAAKIKREKDIADLKRQGYTDELIATIIPTINNGG